MDSEQLDLFAVDETRRVPLPEPVPDPYAGLSADRRRTLRQAEQLGAGRHPLTRRPLHPEAAPADDRNAPGRRCGNCRFREVLGHHNKAFAKCVWTSGDVPLYLSHGAATDVRAWWPACPEHEWGETRLSPDAARWVPPAA